MKRGETSARAMARNSIGLPQWAPIQVVPGDGAPMAARGTVVVGRDWLAMAAQAVRILWRSYRVGGRPGVVHVAQLGLQTGHPGEGCACGYALRRLEAV